MKLKILTEQAIKILGDRLREPLHKSSKILLGAF